MSDLTYEGVKSYVKKSHFTYGKSRVIYERVMSRVNDACHV